MSAADHYDEAKEALTDGAQVFAGDDRILTDRIRIARMHYARAQVEATLALTEVLANASLAANPGINPWTGEERF